MQSYYNFKNKRFIEKRKKHLGSSKLLSSAFGIKQATCLLKAMFLNINKLTKVFVHATHI